LITKAAVVLVTVTVPEQLAVLLVQVAEVGEADAEKPLPTAVINALAKAPLDSVTVAVAPLPPPLKFVR
jgi:hypothetical protein